MCHLAKCRLKNNPGTQTSSQPFNAPSIRPSSPPQKKFKRDRPRQRRQRAARLAPPPATADAPRRRREGKPLFAIKMSSLKFYMLVNVAIVFVLVVLQHKDDDLYCAEYCRDIFTWIKKIETKCVFRFLQQKASVRQNNVFKLFVHFVFSSQKRYAPDANYMPIQTDVNEKMRAILIDWLIEVHHKFKLCSDVLYLYDLSLFSSCFLQAFTQYIFAKTNGWSKKQVGELGRSLLGRVGHLAQEAPARRCHRHADRLQVQKMFSATILQRF